MRLQLLLLVWLCGPGAMAQLSSSPSQVEQSYDVPKFQSESASELKQKRLMSAITEVERKIKTLWDQSASGLPPVFVEMTIEDDASIKLWRVVDTPEQSATEAQRKAVDAIVHKVDGDPLLAKLVEVNGGSVPLIFRFGGVTNE